jgi:alpha-1,2-mannosyltransferase
MFPQSLLNPRAVRMTWIVWGLFLLSAFIVLVGLRDWRPASNAYARGASRWLAASNLYDEGGRGFIYLPQSAILYAPFSLVPQPAQHFLWRSVTIGLFVAGVYGLCRLAGRGTGIEFFPLVSLLILPKAWTCALNGQAAPAMAGLSMLALVALHAQRWWCAALLLTAALTFKPLAFVLILVVAALYPPTWRPLALALAGFFAFPYLLQGPQYVTGQYVASIHMFESAAKVGLSPEWAQLFSLGSLAGINSPPHWQTVIRIVAAIATMALCREARRRFESSRALIDVYALATAYLLLFNPRTENNSYLLLSPVLGVLWVRAQFVEGQKARAALLCAAAVAIFAGHELCGLLTPQAGFVWICPLVCALFALDLVLQVSGAANLAPPANSVENSRLAQPAVDSR